MYKHMYIHYIYIYMYMYVVYPYRYIGGDDALELQGRVLQGAPMELEPPTYKFGKLVFLT